MPLHDKGRTLRMAKLHLDATRSASLFAERMLLVEGVSDAVLVRQFGRAWAAGDPYKQGLIDALTITVMGTKVGRWPVDLLATPGHEIVSRIAILTDTDTRGDAQFTPASWTTDRDPDIVQAFYSPPTLEPAITVGNEPIVSQILATMGFRAVAGIAANGGNVTANDVDEIFQNAGRQRKGEFALLLGAELSRRMDVGEPVTVPPHFQQMFEYLFANPLVSDADTPSPDL